jgi:hypothetical protein
MGRVDQALKVAELIEEPSSKSDALIRIVKALVQLDEQARAITILNQALAVVDTIRNQHNQAVELGQTALILAQLGHIDQALTIAEMNARVANLSISSQEILRTVLIQIGQDLTGVGQQEQALYVLRTACTRARQRGRSSVFSVLQASAVTLAAIDNGQILWYIYEAIQEVDSWWATP